MTLERFTGGTPSAREKLNAVVDELNSLGRLRGDDQFINIRRGPGGAIATVNVGSIRARVPNPIQKDWEPVLNASGYAIPLGGLVWLKGMESDEVTYTGKRFDYPCVSRFGVAVADIPKGQPSAVWVFGDRIIRLADYAGVSIGERVGPGMDTFDAVRYEGGPLLVRAKITEPYAWASITGDRLDSKMADTASDADDLPYKVYGWGEAYVLTQPRVGVTRVEMA